MARYHDVEATEEKNRVAINKEIQAIKDGKRKVVVEHDKIMEKLDNDCSDDELRYIAEQLRKRDKEQF